MDLPVRGTQSDTQTREILANLVVPLVVRLPAEKLALAVSYAESGADGRIRTGDPLFTNQDFTGSAAYQRVLTSAVLYSAAGKFVPISIDKC